MSGALMKPDTPSMVLRQLSLKPESSHIEGYSEKMEINRQAENWLALPPSKTERAVAVWVQLRHGSPVTANQDPVPRPTPRGAGTQHGAHFGRERVVGLRGHHTDPVGGVQVASVGRRRRAPAAG